MMNNIFDFSGIARLSDLKTEDWKKLYQPLEIAQEQFLKLDPFPKAYPWPKDPLHQWSRVWEYPFVFNHLQKIGDREKKTVVDIGSGVTFFPFLLADIGFGKVVALDNDHTYSESFHRINGIRKKPVNFKLGSASETHFEPGSVNVVYCISVLEHIPDPVVVLNEIHKMLSDDGILILTFDMALKGNLELSPTQFFSLKQKIANNFDFLIPETVTHPSDILKTSNSPFGLKNGFWIKRQLKPLIDKISQNQDPYRKDFDLAIYGAVLKKRI